MTLSAAMLIAAEVKDMAVALPVPAGPMPTVPSLEEVANSRA